jgi:glycosyltransferase involved in cell wall biosynthesis
MLGMGWFPASIGGLDRYYRALLEQLPEASGVTVGPRGDAPARVRAASRQSQPLPLRVLLYWRSASRAARASELVDAHFGLYAAAPLLLGSARKAPTVFHFHGPWAEEGAAAGQGSRARYLLRRALEGAVVRRADAHVVLSGAFARLLIEHHRIAPWELHTIAPGVDLDLFAPGEREAARAQLGLAPGAFVACCARRLVPRMGLDLLLDAWEMLAPALPDGSTLLLVGDGPLRRSCAERAGLPPLAGSVRVLGRVDDRRLAEVYRASDVAVVPSTAVEGFGLVVLEAAACGTPSVVSDVGGLPEAIAALDPSLVVPSGDRRALSARLQRAAAGSLPSRSATRAHAERFAWRTAVERHRRLYRRLCAGAEDERMRVVYLDHIARLSGGEIALLRVLPQLQRTRAHAILGEDGPLARRLAQTGSVTVEVLPIAARARELRKDAVRIGPTSLASVPATAAYVLRLVARLRALRPDVVHTNTLKAGVYGSLAARIAGVPVVWHVRDRIAEDYLPSTAVKLMRALIGSLPDAVIANSDATMQTLGPGPAGQPRVMIPETVAAPSPPPPRSTNGGPLTFGMVGRIAPWKGQELFLRAFARAFPDGGARAAIVGNSMFGERDYELTLPDLASSLGIAERVDFRGFREDVWGELAGFDALVHASLTPEPFGQVVLEGMAVGLAVIAADAGGPATLISHGQSGLLFAPGNERALAERMREIGADAAERARMGDAARETAAHYHPAMAASEIERLYERVLAEHPARGRIRSRRG